ncbi:hypothetical protein ACLBR5_17865 [Escherichia coli]
MKMNQQLVCMVQLVIVSLKSILTGVGGVYDSSSGQWSPLGLAQGGTGGRTIEQARANLRVMYEQKAGLANTDLKHPYR